MTSRTDSQAQVLLVRHGETALNAAGRLRGLLDPPLAATGFEQVRSLARFLAPRQPSRVVSGPLMRTVQTACLIGREIGLESVIDDALQDRDYNQWAGHLQSDVLREWGSLDAAPGVESARSVLDRGQRALAAQIPYLGARPVVMVSHDAVITHLLSLLAPRLGPPNQIRQRTACFNELRYLDGQWTVQSVDQIAPAPVPSSRLTDQDPGTESA